MAVWSGMSAGLRAAIVAVGVGVVAVAGYLGVRGEAVEPQVGTTVAVDAVAEAPVVAADPAAAVVADPAAANPVAEAVVPSFDVVRVAPDGAATVAGAAASGAVVSLRVDGVEAGRAVADGQGKFAALFDLPPSAVPRLLSLVAIAPDGAEVLGKQTVALAPTAAVPPVAVAAAAADTVADADTPVVQAPAALLVSPEGVKVLQPGAAVPAEVAANISIDTITYAPDGAVLLGGRGQGAAVVRIYLDGAAVAEAVVGADGQWALTLGAVVPGIYTLRADQVGADGRVTSRMETPFKRETLEALAQAATSDAAAGVADVPAAAADQVAAVEPVAVEPAAVAPVAAEPVAAAEPAKAADPAVAEPAAVAEAAVSVDAVVAATAAPAVSVTVQPGFTLWGIAQTEFGAGVMYVQLFEANKDKIRDPNLIYPGQVFTIPAAK